ncbi:MAG TPA: GAF domain-containing sensor histidine kinase [Actinoplanes sp.]|nr:GAF domain-containing sensor histidine kinase [Actinoplanes sp.]
MRPVSAAFAVAGGLALAVAAAIEAVAGDPTTTGWLLVGPVPFYAVGLAAALRRPDHPMSAWLLASGTFFMLDVCLGDVVLPEVASRSWAWIVALVWAWVANVGVVAGLGAIGLFPTGVADTPGSRWILRTAALASLLLPVLCAVSNRTLPTGWPGPDEPTIASPFYWPPAAPLAPVADVANFSFGAASVVGLVMLALRYRRYAPPDRRRIRWLLTGMVAGVSLALPLMALVWVVDPSRLILIAWFVWPLSVVLMLGSIVIAVFHDGVFGIERPMRRRLAYRTLVGLIALAYVAVAATLGVLAARYLPTGLAVLLAVCATLLFQPIRHRLERWADRWIFGARLDGYEVLARFGATLESAPGPAELLPDLADVVRHGLGLRWARVVLDAPGGEALSGASGIGAGDPAGAALVVPLTHGGATLGRIECGPRPDGLLLAEDRALLGQLAGQAATAVRNLHLASELANRLEVIRRQAAELSASRARLARAQDTERQRIQRDLHDGVQQDLVVSMAKLAMARERLRRGDPRAAGSLDELQNDLGALLAGLREFAHSIHPAALADQGLLEALEGHAGRLPVEVVIEADTSLRGVRYPQSVETAAWYLLSEALTNAVKHSGAEQVTVGLAQPNGRLIVEVRDDGRGFDPAAGRGLGLSGLADRMSVVAGTFDVSTVPGRGTTLRAEIPLAGGEDSDG